MIAFRPMLDRDLMFVISGWSSSYRTSYTAGMIQMEDWADVMHPQIRKALARPDVRVMVAHETNDPDPLADLQGFIVADTELTPPLVYYVYVKGPYRKSGVARGLFNAIGVDPSKPFHYVCNTPIASELYQLRKIPLADYRPLSGRFRKESRDRQQIRQAKPEPHTERLRNRDGRNPR